MSIPTVIKQTPGGGQIARVVRDSVVISSATSWSHDTVMLRNEYNVDPANPYYYLYGGGSTTSTSAFGTAQAFTAQDSAANSLALCFKTNYRFYDGSTNIANIDYLFGDQVTMVGANIIGGNLSSPAIRELMINPMITDGSQIEVYDPFGACVGDSTAGNAQIGFCAKWTSQANRVIITTTLLIDNLCSAFSTTTGIPHSAYTPPITLTNNGGSVWHGLIQHPWGKG